MRSRTLILAVLISASMGCGDDGTPPGTDGGGIDAPVGDGGENVDCTGMADGTACAETQICLAESCVSTRCGDGFVDTAGGEACDDGNEVSGDGCEPSECSFSCTVAADCDDANPCTGEETCNAVANRCQAGDVPTVETACELADAGGAGVCAGGVCAPPGCGNGTPDGSEDCDDGNAVAGDGCEPNCTFTCSGDADCADDDACNGTETCDTTSHLCSPAAAPTDCDDGDACTADTCDIATGCSNVLDDGDMDGFAPAETCTDPMLEGGDCDDSNNTVFPGAAEQCDAVDHDCDGAPMNDVVDIMCIRDGDGDGFGNASLTMTACMCPAGYVAPRADGLLDCFDSNASAFPGQRSYFATSRCPPRGICPIANRYDYNCDGTETRQYPRTIACTISLSDPSGCTGHGWTGTTTVPACGERAFFNNCVNERGSCRPRAGLIGMRTQACR